MQALLRAASERSSMNLEAAREYARAHGLRALIVMRGNDVLAQEYGEGFDARTPHPLYSGTKSFWGVLALYASEDGLLELDEPIAGTIESWREDPWKRRVTVRMLLSLTAGFGFGGLGASVPPYERALAKPLANEPGTRFTYGGVPLQVFGAFLARKLADRELTPHAYLGERVLVPAGVSVASWRKLPDGTQTLPTGASLSAESWIAYGRFIIRNRAALAPCFAGSSVNARYGLGWWLGARCAPPDLAYASGSAGQALYLVPSLDLAIAHFGKSSSYRHERFMQCLFGGASKPGRSARKTRHSAAS
jgi:CubicO group peptidase (beta-lactamase class C family)